jgi:hypothetical protein
VSKSKGRSRHQSIIYHTCTTTMPTSVAATDTLLLSKALGRIRCSNGKESIVNSAYSAALYRMLTTMTTTASAAASASRSLP